MSAVTEGRQNTHSLHSREPRKRGSFKARKEAKMKTSEGKSVEREQGDLKTGG